MKFLQTLPKVITKINFGHGFDWITGISRLPSRGISFLRYMFTDSEYVESSPNVENITQESSFKHISFTFSAISLSALVARADGAVSQAEYLAFRDSFPLTGGMCGKIRQLFLLACQNSTPLTTHIQQIKSLFPNQKELFISLIDRLFCIAIADKPLSREEERLLAKIAHSLDLSPSEYSLLYDKYSRPLAAHVVLGVEKRSPKDIIKKRYHALMNRYHPDRFSATAVSSEVEMLLTLKTTEINQAYRKLSKIAA